MASLVSLSMIVRNEEKLIERAIESSTGLVDDVVIVDTGSTDNTVPMCNELGAQVIVGADRMNKGESRNVAIKAATGEWVFILDADEIILDPVGLRGFIENTDADALYVKLVFVDGNGNPTLTYPQMRVFRKGTYLYKYRAHEVPVPVNGWGKVLHTDFVIEHRQPPERGEWKPQYTLDRLLLDEKENPDNARVSFYLGRQYFYCRDYEKCIETMAKYHSLGGGINTGDSWLYTAFSYEKLDQENEMVTALYRACQAEPTRRRWWGRLAEYYHAKGQDETAIALLNCAFSIPEPTKTFAYKKWYGSHIHDLAARCYWKLERIIEGRYHARKALDLDPDNERLKNNLDWFLPEGGRLPQLIDSVPELYRGSKKVLYVGANRMRSDGLSLLKSFGHEITLLEIFPSNAEFYMNDERLEHVITGDVREIDSLDLPYNRFDVVFWWHGPEHIDRDDFKPTVEKLENIADLIVLATPWGYYRNPPSYGNKNEEHRWRCLIGDFKSLGYSVVTQGEKDAVGSHLLAWRQVG